MRPCVHCGRHFLPRRRNHVRCVPTCRPKSQGDRRRERARRRRRTDAHELTFVGVDGEGVTEPDGTHRYVLLTIGDEAVHRDGKTLTFHDVCAALWEHFTLHKDAVYVGFYLGYDFAQWLRELPPERAHILLSPEGIAKRQRKVIAHAPPFPVRWNGWEFDFLGFRRFRLRPEKDQGSWLYVCDAGPFFQSSLLSALDPSAWDASVITPQEYALIAEGKARRADATFDAAMMTYNAAENRALAAVMTEVNRGLTSVGIKLSRAQWIGPGQAAGEWLRMQGAQKRDELIRTVPGPVLRTGARAYSGGWFETAAHGHVGTVYEHDINSAYPAAIATLPCLRHGTWEHHRGRPAEPGTLTLCRVSAYSQAATLAPLQHRLRDGRMAHPLRTAGWHWAHELTAAVAVDPHLRLQWHETWTYRPCGCPPPLRAIADLYTERKRVGKNSAHGRAIKLIINSVYGKLAQSVGGATFANPIHAGLVTSLTRTQLLYAIASTDPANVLMTATDAVYSTVPLAVPLGDALGAWERQVRPGMTIQLPGLYWDDTTRHALEAGQSPKLKSRGIRAADLAAAVGTLDEQWDRFDGHSWPELDLPVAFAFVTPRQAVARGAWETAGTLLRGEVRHISANPESKRDPASAYRDDDGRWRTRPYSVAGGSVVSAPYDARFGLDAAQLAEDWDALTWDGGLTSDLHEMLAG